MKRYACLEIRVNCGSCGQSIPVNGPFNRVTCAACFEEMPVSERMIGSLLNDFEEEREELRDGQGRGGTVMSGSGTYRYGYWNLEPRCSECRKPLNLPEDGTSEAVACSECGEEYHFLPAPDWLEREVPSAVSCVTPERPPGHGGEEQLAVNENSSRPIVMTCPSCAGSLTVSSKSERIMNCEYCSSEVYVPDEVWKRLHPVRLAREWFVILAGKTRKQMQTERRRLDEAEEEEFLKGWKLRNAPKKAGRKLRTFLPLTLLFGAAIAAITILSPLTGTDEPNSAGFGASIALVAAGAAVTLIPVWLVVRSAFSSKVGRGRASKKALAALADRHGWKHEGTEYSSTPGSIHAKYRGRDIEINPAEEYAIEVDIHDSFLYLKTEPPGYPGEEVRRFTAPDRDFNETFPIRYAKPEFAERIERSEDEARSVLAPVYWFLGSWNGRLGRMKVDWSAAGVHLSPGHLDPMGMGGRYLLPEDLEPLLEDMMLMAAGLDAVSSGREPDLPQRMT